MPTVEATPIPHAGLVQVDVDAADLAARWIRLERVMADTGEVTVVRPNTSYAGDYMETSNYAARFFDTDAPTDRTFYYQVISLDDPDLVWPGVAAADATSVVDTFTRTVGAGPDWGTPDVGAAWTSAFSTTTEALVAGGDGTLSMGTEDALRGQHLDGGTFRENWTLRYQVGLDIAAPTGEHVYNWTYLRSDGPANNYLAIGVVFRTSGVVGWQAAKAIGGVSTNIGSGLTEFSHTAATYVQVKVQAIGDYLRLKVFPTGPEPEEWTHVVAVPDVPKNGKCMLAAYVPAASTTALPVVFDFDNVRAFGATDGEATHYILDSEGGGWLRDPVNPCHNIRLSTCIDASPCAAPGLSFESGDTSGWSTVNATLTPTTAQRFTGRYSGELTADYTSPPTGAGTPTPVTRYTFDATAEGWVGEGTASAARVTTPTPHDGAGMLEVTKTMGAGTEAIRFNDAAGPRDLSGDGSTVAVWALVPAGAAGTGWVAHIEVQDPGFTWIPGPDFTMTPGVWRRLTFTPPAGLLANMRSIGMSFAATGVGGSQAVYIDTVQQGGSPAALGKTRLAVTPGRAVTADAWLLATSALDARVTINWYAADNSYLSTTDVPYTTLPAGIWTRGLVTVDAPASAAWAEFTAVMDGTPTAGAGLYVDMASLAYREPATSGIFFAALDEVGRAAQSQTISVVGDRLPVNVSLPRRAPDGNFTVVSRSFTDRDALVTLLGEGTPVQLDMPEVYGIPTMTMAIGDTTESRGMVDHRYQPRIHRLPYAQVRPQEGPGNGPCGAKYEDLCADPALDTWGEVASAALTYNQLIDVT